MDRFCTAVCRFLRHLPQYSQRRASNVVPTDKLSVVITIVLAVAFLHERFTPKSLVGCILITVGTLIIVL